MHKILLKLFIVNLALFVSITSISAQTTTSLKQMEYLTRGVVAVRVNSNQVLVSWRMLGTDPESISFNVYRNGTMINSSPITNSTNYVDNITTNGSYTVKCVSNGVETDESLAAAVWENNYLRIPLQRPAGGTTPTNATYTYAPGDASVGDVDGDGVYEIILKWDPSNAQDNANSGYTGNVLIDAYKLDGSRLWRIDLGRNIRAGSHYTQFMVYDFDGDGKAEMACKTSDGTVDGTGVVIGSATADYRTTNGYILSGPEFLTMFNGLTGKAMSTVNFIPGRGTVSSWGDNYGNRVDRFVSSVAYLDGVKPSLIMGRGYYTRLVRIAWDFTDGKLVQRWTFDGNTTGNSSYNGQGNHQTSVADVDGDGKDEMINGSSVINDNGTGLWANGMGHGDALHVGDLDPNRAGTEIWMPYESPANNGKIGAALIDAKTGVRIFTVSEATADVGRGMSADLDPRYPGFEVWAARGGLYKADGTLITNTKPSMNFGIWWDGDLSRELLDGTNVTKWNHLSNNTTTLLAAAGQSAVSNNSTKSTPCLSADILGDWREEIIYRTSDNQNLLLYTTPYVTDKRLVTLMHDSQYRVAIAWQNSAYNQPPYPSFFLGTDMATPPTPNIYVVGGTSLPISLIDFKAKANNSAVSLTWSTASQTNNKLFTIERSADGEDFTTIANVNGAGTSNKILNYTSIDYSPLSGNNYYRLRQTDFDGKSTTSGVQLVSILQKQKELSIYPNPVQDYVSIQLNGAGSDLKLTFSTVNGLQLLSVSGSLEQLNSKLNTVIPTLASGVYFVKVVDGTNTYSQKLLKK